MLRNRGRGKVPLCCWLHYFRQKVAQERFSKEAALFGRFRGDMNVIMVDAETRANFI